MAEEWPSWWGSGKGGDGTSSTGPYAGRDPTPTGETYVGTVKSKTMKFGFVHCPEVSQKYNSDVFCLGNQLMACEVGEEVIVEVGLNHQGKPQAITVNGEKGDKNFSTFASGMSSGVGMKGANQAVLNPEPTGEMYTGTVKSKTFKFGFIHCPEARLKYTSDVFCLGNQLVNHQLGEEVVVEVGLNLQGQPQAITVNGEKGDKNFSMNMMGGGFGKGKGGHPGQNVTPTGEMYNGVVKSKTFKFGFVHCPEAFLKYGKDIFCRGDQILWHEIGEEVLVEVGLNMEGQPQAITVNGEKGDKESYFNMMGFPPGKGKGSQAAQDETTDIAFEPGTLGFKYDGDSGAVAQVGAGQAQNNGVEVGWVISSIDGSPFTKELMVAKRISELPYVITFVRPGTGGGGGFGGGGKGCGGNPDMMTMMWQMMEMMKGKGKGKMGEAMGKGPFKRKELESTGTVYVGIVKSNTDKFGFIACPELAAQYGCDAFCLGNQLAAFNVGDPVQFDIGLNDRGQPQAINVEGAAGALGEPSGIQPSSMFGGDEYQHPAKVARLNF